MFSGASVEIMAIETKTGNSLFFNTARKSSVAAL